MAPSTTTATTLTNAMDSSSPQNRRRSLSGASALLTRRFTRQISTPRPTSSRSESIAKSQRRATIAAEPSITNENVQVHVRIVPNIENPSRSLIFDIVDRQLQVGGMIRVGRYSERHANLNCMSFKSKVVSRCHCEVWVENDGKLYIRDTKSSSGTFLNHVRLSPAGSESRPVEVHDGDIVQLGVDFQGGREEMYRSVKMRFEVNRSNRSRPLSFSLNAFQNLRNLTQQGQNGSNSAAATVAAAVATTVGESSVKNSKDTSINSNALAITTKATHAHHDEHEHKHALITDNKQNNNTNVTDDLDECCICLYALAPFQALFVSPCSHTYHFKCIRPLLQSYPGFQCPICRTYSDLEANVAIETDEVAEQFTNNRQNTIVAESSTVFDAPAPLITSAEAAAELETEASAETTRAADSELDLQSSPSTSSDIMVDEPLDIVNGIGHPSTERPITNAEEEHEDTYTGSSGAIPLHVSNPFSTTFISSPIIYSEPLPESPSLHNQHSSTTDILQHVIEESFSSNLSSFVPAGDDEQEDNGVVSNTDEEELEDALAVSDEDEVMTNPQPAAASESTRHRSRDRKTSHIMDKIKMVFFEKRKSTASPVHSDNSNKNRRKNNNDAGRQRPLSYPTLLPSVVADVPLMTRQARSRENNASSSNRRVTRTHNLSQTLSRQSVSHLSEVNGTFRRNGNISTRQSVIV